jgi:hypothetical protein
MRKIGLLLAISVCMGASVSAYAQEVGRYAIVPAKDGALILDTKEGYLYQWVNAPGVSALFFRGHPAPGQNYGDIIDGDKPGQKSLRSPH